MKYTITLAYQGKQYSWLDDWEYQDDENWTADRHVLYMYDEGNYACDCNRSDFLCQYCDVDFKDAPDAEWDERYTNGGAWTLPCGDTITLVSIKDGERVIYPEKPLPPLVVWRERPSGLIVPTEI